MSPNPIIDIYDEHWERAAFNYLGALTAQHPDLRPVALLDGAFLFDRLLPWMEQWLPRHSWASVYEGLPNTDRQVIQASPQLVDLHQLDDLQRSVLLKGTSGYPMLSIMMTDASLSQLASQWKAFCIISTPSARYTLRFADTRLLPTIMHILTSEQQTLFSHTIHAWHYVDRAAQWASLPLIDKHDNTVIPPINGIAFDNEQFKALMNAAQIDRAMAFIDDTSPELYACWQRPSERYQWFQQHMALADAPAALAELPAYLEQHAERQQLLKKGK